MTTESSGLRHRPTTFFWVIIDMKQSGCRASIYISVDWIFLEAETLFSCVYIEEDEERETSTGMVKKTFALSLSLKD